MRGCGQVAGLVMVEVIQQYGLSTPTGAGSLNLSADNAGLPDHRGAKPDSLTTPHFVEKNSFAKSQKR